MNWLIKAYPSGVHLSIRGIKRRGLNAIREPVKGKVVATRTPKRKTRVDSSEVDELEEEDVSASQPRRKTRSTKAMSQSTVLSVPASTSSFLGSTNAPGFGPSFVSDKIAQQLNELEQAVEDPSRTSASLRMVKVKLQTLRDFQNNQLSMVTKWVERVGPSFDDLEARIEDEISSEKEVARPSKKKRILKQSMSQTNESGVDESE